MRPSSVPQSILWSAASSRRSSATVRIAARSNSKGPWALTHDPPEPKRASGSQASGSQTSPLIRPATSTVWKSGKMISARRRPKSSRTWRRASQPAAHRAGAGQPLHRLVACVIRYFINVNKTMRSRMKLIYSILYPADRLQIEVSHLIYRTAHAARAARPPPLQPSR